MKMYTSDSVANRVRYTYTLEKRICQIYFLHIQGYRFVKNKLLQIYDTKMQLYLFYGLACEIIIMCVVTDIYVQL